MPVFEYRCKDEACAAKTEKLRSWTRRTDPVQCARCGGETYPVMSKPGRFQRGSGWHARMDGSKVPGEF